MKFITTSGFIRPSGTIGLVDVPNPAVNCWAILVCPSGAKRQGTPRQTAFPKRNILACHDSGVSSSQPYPGQVGTNPASLKWAQSHFPMGPTDASPQPTPPVSPQGWDLFGGSNSSGVINTSNLIWTFSNEQVDPFLAQSSDPYAPNFVMPNYGYAIGVVANSTANVASQRSSYDDNGAWYRRFRCCNKGRQGPKREHGCASRHSRKSVSASAQFSGRSQFWEPATGLCCHSQIL